MAVIMKQFCCCKEANLRTGTIFVGVLTLLGCLLMLAEFILGPADLSKEEHLLESGNFTTDMTERFGNMTMRHLRDTRTFELVTAALYFVQFLISGLLIYGAVKRIRWILNLYLVCTVMIALWDLSGLVFLAVFGPHMAVIAVGCFMFGLLLAVAIYFFLVVYSYSELIKEQQNQNVLPSHLTMDSHDPPSQAPWQSKPVYKRFMNSADADDTTMTDDYIA